MRKTMLIVLSAFSTLAMSENVKPTAVRMTDAELDQVTAAAAQTLHLILNSGNAVRTNNDPSNFFCLNCEAVGGPIEGAAMGASLIFNRGHPQGRLRCFGGIVGVC